MTVHSTSTLLLSIQEYLDRESVKYDQISPEKIHIHGYDRSRATANISLFYPAKRQRLSIDTDRDLVVDAPHWNQIMEFLNHVNSVISDGNFHICPDSSRLIYRTSFAISDEPMEPERIEQNLDAAALTYQFFAWQITLLMTEEITFEEAIACC